MLKWLARVFGLSSGGSKSKTKNTGKSVKKADKAKPVPTGSLMDTAERLPLWLNDAKTEVTWRGSSCDEDKVAAVRDALLQKGVLGVVPQLPDVLAQEIGEDGVVVARGREVVPSVDPEVELFIKLELVNYKERENGTADFRARGMASTVVQAGERLARVTPGKLGRPGETVFGEEVAVEPPAPELVAGEGVMEGGNGLVAEVDGRARQSGDRLVVVPSLEISGDVGYATGHVNSGPLGVAIAGGVQPGFEVVAGRDIEVRGTVEDGSIRCGGNVLIGGGLIGRGDGHVSCQGGLDVRFIQGARIDCTGDIVAPGGLVQANVRCGGSIVSTGPRGCISGGTVVASGDIRITRAGSSSGGKTQIIAGSRPHEQALLDSILAPREERFEHLSGMLGERVNDWTSETVPADHADDFAEWIQLKEGIARLIERRDGSWVKTADSARVHIEGECHPGVTIAIAGQSIEVKMLYKRVTARIDPETGDIGFVPLTR